MNFAGWAIWGFAATLVLTILMTGAQAFNFTRMSIPYILGLIHTPDRDRARLYGIFMHMLNGWLIALIYIACFYNWGGAAWWKGAIIGLVHACFLLVTMPIFPSIHPRMANELYGPTVVKQLEPPGFLAINYGFQTPIWVVISHVIFGTILGAFYRT